MQQRADLDQVGPVDHFVVAFPGDHVTGEALRLLSDLVTRGLIRVLDLAFLREDAVGAVSPLTLAGWSGCG